MVWLPAPANHFKGQKNSIIAPQSDVCPAGYPLSCLLTSINACLKLGSGLHPPILLHQRQLCSLRPSLNKDPMQLHRNWLLGGLLGFVIWHNRTIPCVTPLQSLLSGHSYISSPGKKQYYLLPPSGTSPLTALQVPNSYFFPQRLPILRRLSLWHRSKDCGSQTKWLITQCSRFLQQMTFPHPRLNLGKHSKPKMRSQLV